MTLQRSFALISGNLRSDVIVLVELAIVSIVDLARLSVTVLKTIMIWQFWRLVLQSNTPIHAAYAPVLALSVSAGPF
jgi:hypothetical protein